MKTKYKIFIASIIYKLLSFLGFQKYQEVKRGGIIWNLDISEGIDLNQFIFGSFEREVLKMIKKLSDKKDFDIIDIGANSGSMTLQFAKDFPNSKIFAIEPTRYAYEKLIKNIKLNKKYAEKISSFQLFLSNKKIPLDIFSSWSLENENNRHDLHKGIKKQTAGAKSISLDQFIKNNNISGNLLIKCDVDGFELDVFKSGTEYLRKNKPNIVMEYAPYLYKENNYTESELIDFFLDLNYIFYNGKNMKKINDMFSFSKNLKIGSSVNIFLK